MQLTVSICLFCLDCRTGVLLTFVCNDRMSDTVDGMVDTSNGILNEAINFINRTVGVWDSVTLCPKMDNYVNIHLTVLIMLILFLTYISIDFLCWMYTKRHTLSFYSLVTGCTAVFLCWLWFWLISKHSKAVFQTLWDAKEPLGMEQISGSDHP